MPEETRCTVFDSEHFQDGGTCPICGGIVMELSKIARCGPPEPLVFYNCEICGRWGAPGVYRYGNWKAFSGRWELSICARTRTVRSEPAPFFYIHSDESSHVTTTNARDEFSLEPLWIETVFRRAVVPWDQRLEILLVNLAAIAKRPGQKFPLRDGRDYPLGACEGPDEFRTVFCQLKAQGLVDDGIRIYSDDYALAGGWLTYDGWTQLKRSPLSKGTERCTIKYSDLLNCVLKSYENCLDVS